MAANNDEKSQPDDESAPANAASKRSPRAMVGWVFASRLRAVLVLGACLASIGGGVASWILLSKTPPRPVEAKITLKMCLDTMDAGDHPRAAGLAKRLQETGDHTTVERGGTAFVQGVAAATAAQRLVGKTRVEQYFCAARYLEEASELGFPPDREGEGFFWLGKSLFLCGRMSGAREALTKALALGYGHQAELHHMLAEAFLRGEDVDVQEATMHNAAYLAEEGLSPEGRDDGILQRADILIRLDCDDDCAKAIDDLSASARRETPALVIRGRLLMRAAAALAKNGDADTAKEKYLQAISLLRKAETSDTRGTGTAEDATYLIGECFLDSGDFRAALAQFQRVRRIHSNRAAGAAASIQEANLLQREGDWSGALGAYLRGMENTSSPAEYANPWISLAELRSRVKAFYNTLLEKKEFGACVKLAGLLSMVFGKVKSLEMTVEACESWSRDLTTRAEGMTLAKAEPLRREARTHLREAGDIYAELAKLNHAARQYPDELWNAAGCHFQGRDYRTAVAEIDEYLKNEMQRRRPLALVTKGEALAALDQMDDAIAAFEECIAYYPKDVVSLRARLLAAQAWNEKGESTRAESLLLENLSGEVLSPASKEWRESLFQLGEMLHAQQRYEEATSRLDEAMRRYGNATEAFAARYLLAHSRHEIAKAALDELEKELSAEERATYQRQFAENIAKAEEGYREIREASLRREAREGLSPNEAAIARNAVFALGAILCDRDDLPSAIKLYYAAANRAFDQPEALSAYLQIARLYRRLGKTVESKTTIEQAKSLLAGLKADADLLETTNYDRKQWSDLLDSFGKL